MSRILGRAHCRPTALMRRMLKHRGDVSEGSADRLLATRIILGRRVDFYRNGRRELHGSKLTDTEMHDSELLRFAHASLLDGTGVGDKLFCWVDATKNPVEVWLFGKQINRVRDVLDESALDLPLRGKAALLEDKRHVCIQ